MQSKPLPLATYQQMETKKRSTQVLFEIMVDYMERHGDLSAVPQGLQGRLENLQRWNELVAILNKKSEYDAKPIEKWRKAWSDLKNNTKKKILKIRRHGGDVSKISDMEKRLMMLLKRNRRKRKRSFSDGEETEIHCKEEVIIEDSNSFSPPRFFTAEQETTGQRKSSMSSSASTSSSTPPKKKKRNDPEAEMKELTDKFLELEKEREKMAHESEMARIRQNDKMLSMFGRVISVLETLAPSIQRYLDRDVNGDR